MSTLSISSFSPILEGLPSPTLLVNRDYLIVKANRKAAEFLKISAEQLEGMKFKKIAGKRFVHHQLEKRASGEKLVVLKTQTEKKIQSHVSYQAHQDGFVISLVQNDTTAEDSLEQWAAATFHDMNQFLYRAGLEMCLVEQALSSLPENSARAEFEDMKFNFASALHIAGAVADMHRIRMGTLELEPEHVDNVADLFQKLFTGFERQAAAKQIRLVTKTDFGGVTQFFADHQKIDRILSNLVTNAIQHTPERGEILIEVKAALNLENRKISFDLKVKDNGPGIPEKYLEKIFRQGVRVDKSGQGLGIGLANCRAFVHLMGGKISASNRKGMQGAKFHATFFAKEKSTSPNSLRKKTIDVDKHKGLRALIVDDNKMNRVLLRKLLEKWNYIFTEAVDGEDMLKILSAAREEGAPFDFVICDNMMPRMKGDEATKKWREEEKLHGGRLPIFGLTACISAQEINDLQTAGMDKVFLRSEHAKLGTFIPDAVQKYVVNKLKRHRRQET